jgi:hypothetical protein
VLNNPTNANAGFKSVPNVPTLKNCMSVKFAIMRVYNVKTRKNTGVSRMMAEIKCECCDKLLTNDYMTLMIVKDEYMIPLNYCDVLCISIKWGLIEVES